MNHANMNHLSFTRKPISSPHYFDFFQNRFYCYGIDLYIKAGNRNLSENGSCQMKHVSLIYHVATQKQTVSVRVTCSLLLYIYQIKILQLIVQVYFDFISRIKLLQRVGWTVFELLDSLLEWAYLDSPHFAMSPLLASCMY